jgi:hypothetical protein
MFPGRQVGGLLVLLAVAAAAAGQESYDPYGQIYGPPVDVPLADLAQGVVPYEGRPVRTHGSVELYFEPTSQERGYVLRDGGFSIGLVPRPEVANAWNFEASANLGRRMEFTGLFQAATSYVGAGPTGYLEFWKFGAASDEETRRQGRPRTLTLEALVARPERYAGALVSVAGEFRGHNLFADLLMSTRRWPGDWVLKDGLSALWVTGREPRGGGWRLDPALRRDTGKWLEVVGRVEVWKDVVYLRARSVALGRRPAEALATTPAAAPRPPEPPQIVFSLPLDGEAGIPVGARFAIQFSKDMDENTFAGRLVLRYVAQQGSLVPSFAQLKTTYDSGRRALTIDPGDALHPGRQVELVLLAGIKDLDGLALVPRPGRVFKDAVDLLRFEVED